MSLSKSSRWSGIRAMPQGPGLPPSRKQNSWVERPQSVASCLVWNTANTDAQIQPTSCLTKTYNNESCLNRYSKSYYNTGESEFDELETRSLNISIADYSVKDEVQSKPIGLSDISNAGNVKVDEPCSDGNYFLDRNQHNLKQDGDVTANESKRSNISSRLKSNCDNTKESLSRSQRSGHPSAQEFIRSKSFHNDVKLKMRPRSAYSRLYNLPPDTQMLKADRHSGTESISNTPSGNRNIRTRPFSKGAWNSEIVVDYSMSRSRETRSENLRSQNNTQPERSLPIKKDSSGRVIGLIIHRAVSPRNFYNNTPGAAANRFATTDKCFNDRPVQDFDDVSSDEWRDKKRISDKLHSHHLNSSRVLGHDKVSDQYYCEDNAAYQLQSQTRLRHDKDKFRITQSEIWVPTKAHQGSYYDMEDVQPENNTLDHDRRSSHGVWSSPASVRCHCRCCCSHVDNHLRDASKYYDDPSIGRCDCQSLANGWRACETRSIPLQQTRYKKQPEVKNQKKENRSMSRQPIGYVYQTAQNLKDNEDEYAKGTLTGRNGLKDNNVDIFENASYIEEGKENRFQQANLTAKALHRLASNHAEINEPSDYAHTKTKLSHEANRPMKSLRPKSAPTSQKWSRGLGTSLTFPIGCSIKCAQKERVAQNTDDFKESGSAERQAVRRPMTPHKIDIVFDP